jgi:peptidoglycan/xylan/chitin deacetylase (PgdA/CDA1 family)
MELKRKICTGMLTSSNLRYQATITPVYGAEILGNGDLESWVSATDAAVFGEEKTGTSTVNREDTIKHGGNYACRLDIDASNSGADIKQIVGTAGDWLLVNGWVRSSLAGKTAEVSYTSNEFRRNFDPGAAWQEFLVGAEIQSTGTIYFNRGASASASIYYDDLSVKRVTATSMLANWRSTPTGDVQIRARLTVPPGLCGGFLACVADRDNPFQNGLRVTINRCANVTGRDAIQLVQYVNGVRTQSFMTAFTYIAGAELELRKAGDECRVLYAGAQIGIATADAGITNNTNHCQQAIHSSVEFGSFSVGGYSSSAPITLPQNLHNGDAYIPAVVITFDDSLLSTYSEAFAYMEPRKVKGTVYTITSLLGGTYNGSPMMSSAQLLELHAAGWTVANHTRTGDGINGQSQAIQEAEIDGGRDDLVGLGITGNGPLHVAYPGGGYDATTLAAMAAQGMLTGRTTVGASSKSNLPFVAPYEIGGDQVLAAETLVSQQNWLTDLKASRKVGVIVFHDLLADNPTGSNWLTSNFRAWIDFLVLEGVQTLTIEEADRLQSGSITVDHR